MFCVSDSNYISDVECAVISIHAALSCMRVLISISWVIRKTMYMYNVILTRKYIYVLSGTLNSTRIIKKQQQPQAHYAWIHMNRMRWSRTHICAAKYFLTYCVASSLTRKHESLRSVSLYGTSRWLLTDVTGLVLLMKQSVLFCPLQFSIFILK